MPKDIPGVMREFKAGQLHSGSKTGRKVTNPKQAIAIALSEQRQQGKSVAPKPPRAVGVPKKRKRQPSQAIGAKKPLDYY